MAERAPTRTVDQIDKAYFQGLARANQNPENRQRVLDSLPVETRRNLDPSSPTYDQTSDIWQAELSILLGDKHPLLKGKGGQRLTREITRKLKSYGLNPDDPSLPVDVLTKEYLLRVRGIKISPTKPAIRRAPAPVPETVTAPPLQAPPIELQQVPPLPQPPSLQMPSPSTELRRATEAFEAWQKGYHIGQESLPSINHPERNEDSFFVDESQGIVGVFDGMGGMAQGDVASKTASESIKKTLFAGKRIELSDDPATIERKIRFALEGAHYDVRDKLGGKGGTTASVAKVWRGPRGEIKLIVGNVGDSRIYVRKKNGLSTQVTEDGSAVKKDFVDGRLTREEYQAIQQELDTIRQKLHLSEKAQSYFSRRNEIPIYLGADEEYIRSELGMRPDQYLSAFQTKIVDMEPGDIVLLTSDGVHDNLTAGEMQTMFQFSGSPQEIAQNLVRKAHVTSKGLQPDNDRAKPDDVTAVVIKIPEGH